MDISMDMLHWAQALRLGRFAFQMRVETAAWLPRFKGSTLRGAFGAALKRAVCIRSDGNCEVCLVRPSCAYTQLFETLPPEGLPPFHGQRYAPHPYVLEPPLEEKQLYAPGEPLGFGLLLIGRAVDYLPYVIFAIDQAGQRGLGRGRGRFALEAVYGSGGDGEERLLYCGATQRLVSGPFDMDVAAFLRQRLNGPAALNSERLSLKLTFLTPARLRVRGDLQAELSFDRLVRSLLRRLWQLALVHGRGDFSLDHRALIERAQSVTVLSNRLRWLDWERYSHRQQVSMKLGGLVGEVEYGFATAEDRAAFLPLLVLGEMVHVGAGTSFGLGKYEVKSLGFLSTEGLSVPAA